MAVYTNISESIIHKFLADYNIGEIVSYTGIREGIENSNFLLKTRLGCYILTIYEKRVQTVDLPFFLGLMEHLALKGFPCATPVRRSDGTAWGEICGKQAAIITFVPGASSQEITLNHCQLIGQTLAKLHICSASFNMERPNNLSIGSWMPLLERCDQLKALKNDKLTIRLKETISHLEVYWPKKLPKGPIHADLFPDNILFKSNKVSGVIDFYFACTDFFAYDLAICLNAWCFGSDGTFSIHRGQSMLSAYMNERPLNSCEVKALPILSCGAAIRFLLTRLHDWFNTPDTALVIKKDPTPYINRVNFHKEISKPESYGIDLHARRK